MKPPRVAVVAARFNSEITDKLLASCLKTLAQAGIARPAVARVPGSFEIPYAAGRFASSGRFDAVICLGAVLQGQTPQNGHIAAAVLAELARLSVEAGIPVLCGVITPKTWAQAKARTRGKMDRGREAALAAIETLALASERPWACAPRRRHG